MRKGKKSEQIIAIGGLDPSGYAGILADTRVLHDYQIPYRAVATSITAQSKSKFLSWEPVSKKSFVEQLIAVRGKIWGIKIGMLATPHHAQLLLTWLKKEKPTFVLWDTVLWSSTGAPLFRPLRRSENLWKLLKQVDLLTPNIPEAEWILREKIKNLNEMEAAARKMFSLGKREYHALLLKGGHLPSRSKKEKVTDIFFDGRDLIRLSSSRRSGNPRGTGCTLGSAILAEIYSGKGILTSIRNAKRYVLNRLF